MSDEQDQTPDESPVKTFGKRKNALKAPPRAPRAQRPVPAAPETMSREELIAAMQLLVQGMKNNQEADLEVAATIHAQAMKKALRPENEISPMVSAYNPKGETKYPRPKPTQIYMMARYPICDPGNYDTTTWSEIELLNQVKAGAYKVTKSDGMDVEILVSCEKDSAGRPYKTTLFADGKGIMDDEQKQNWPPLLQILTQIVTGEGPTQSYARYQRIIDQREARIHELESQLAAQSA